ncbi:MAG: hypothetical protein WDM92_03685 [Caulobacteraceae bacterium]
MSKTPVPFHADDISALARSLKGQLAARQTPPRPCGAAQHAGPRGRREELPSTCAPKRRRRPRRRPSSRLPHRRGRREGGAARPLFRRRGPDDPLAVEDEPRGAVPVGAVVAPAGRAGDGRARGGRAAERASPLWRPRPAAPGAVRLRPGDPQPRRPRVPPHRARAPRPWRGR